MFRVSSRGGKSGKRKTISRAEAVLRLSRMIKVIHRDLERALAIKAALKEANAIVMATPDAIRPGPETYATVANSLAFDLSMTLARLFEPVQVEDRKGGGKRPVPYKNERASIPLIVHLLQQKRCQDESAKRARQWTPQIPEIAASQEAACRRKCVEAIEAFSMLRRSHDGRQGAARLHSIRNNFFAHTLWRENPKKGPEYRQIFRLADTAREVVAGALFAIQGHDEDFLEVERIRREAARRFWEHALRLPDVSDDYDTEDAALSSGEVEAIANSHLARRRP